MKDFDLKDKQLLISDPIESYFECISTCDIKDGKCIIALKYLNEMKYENFIYFVNL